MSTTTVGTINLSKGQKVDLTKTNPGISKYQVGLGWNPNANVGAQFDLDVSAFGLNSLGKRVDDNHFIFYNNIDGVGTTSVQNADKHVTEGKFGIFHTGDNRTGAGEGDDESLIIDFSKVDPQVESIVFVVTIDEATTRNQNFGQVSGAYIRVFDPATNTEILKYDLNEDYSVETALVFGKLYKKDGEWKFEAVGAGKAGGLAEFLAEY
jgi:tellurium resistance protein TerD